MSTLSYAALYKSIKQLPGEVSLMMQKLSLEVREKLDALQTNDTPVSQMSGHESVRS